MIDTHLHLLAPDRFTYAWTAALPALQGRFSLEDFACASLGCEVEGAVFVEVDVAPHQAAEEARFIYSLATEPGSLIKGVVAAGRPEEEGFDQHLDAIAHPLLKGIRRVLHTQPDSLSQSPLFRENVQRLGARGLSFELCVLQRQLPLAQELVEACPETVFILDHCGVPDIAGNNAPHGEGWTRLVADIKALAKLPNVFGKISGLTAYAHASQRTEEGLRPYMETMLRTFGPGRLVWGGDWPVCNLGTGLPDWCTLTQSLLASLSDEERAALLTHNANRIYNLSDYRA